MNCSKNSIQPVVMAGGRKTMRALLATTCAVGLATPAWAQAAPTQSTAARTAPMSSVENKNESQVEDIIVTAQRRSQAISQVPISVQAISAETLARSGPVDTITLLTRLSPSVKFSPGINFGSSAAGIRGVSSGAIEGGIQPSVALVVNNVPLARQGEFIMDLNDVSTVEVLRGPQGTLFGKNATGGVININTNNPTRKFEGSVQGGLTNDREYFGNAVLNVPLADSVQARFTAYYRNQNPLVKNLGPGNDPFGAKTYGFTGKLNFDIADNFTLLISGGYNYVKSSYGIPVVITPPGAFNTPLGNLQVLATGIAGGYGNTRVNTNKPTVAYDDTKFVQAEMNWQASDKISVASITAYRKFDTAYTVDSDVTPAGYDYQTGLTPTPASYPIPTGYPFRSQGLSSASFGKLPAPEKIEYGSQELRLNYKGDRADVVVGIFYQMLIDAARATNPFFFNGSLIGANPAQYYVSENRYNYKLNNDTAAIFADVTYKLSDALTAFGGLRYTHETLAEVYHRESYNFVPASKWDPNTLGPAAGTAPSSVTDFTATKATNNISGRAGIQWRPSEGLNFYTSYNRGYKGPAAFTGRSAANTAAAPAITKPEIANAFEIGTKLRLFENRVGLGLSLYRQKINNIQQTAVVPGTPFTSLVNAGDLKSKGVEFEGQWQVASGLRLSGGLAYTDAKYAGANAIVPCPSNISCPAIGTAILAGNESIAGRRAAGSPTWAYNAAIDYTQPLGDFGKLEFNLTYSGQSDVQFAVNQDSRTIEPAHGFMNASVTLISNQRWEFQVYARNLTNEFYYASLVSAFPVADKFGVLNRDYKRFGGVSFKYKF